MGRVTRSSARKSDDKAVAAKAGETSAKVEKAPAKKKSSPKVAAAKKESPAKAAAGGVVVTIEACKQWGAFKSRAAKIEKAVGKKATVKINEEKVRETV